jgi:hypothetical protein
MEESWKRGIKPPLHIASVEQIALEEKEKETITEKGAIAVHRNVSRPVWLFFVDTTVLV